MILIYILNDRTIDPATGFITVGQTIILPNPGCNSLHPPLFPLAWFPGSRITYLVMPGDSLGSIANKFNTTADCDRAANQTTLTRWHNTVIYPGEMLVVPINLVTAVPTQGDNFHADPNRHGQT